MSHGMPITVPAGRQHRTARQRATPSSEMIVGMDVHGLARDYTAAWCSRDATRVATHYAPGGTIAINGGEPAPIEEVAQSFIAAFPDIEVFMDELVTRDDGLVEYRWTFTGTSAETGKWVRIPGFEEWTIGADGLIASSRGHFDQTEYDRQLRDGAAP
jgi:nuclear transport factor 2 (NTF2) superfamily protein